MNNSLYFPPFLVKGDRVAIVAPARKVASDAISHATSVIESWGLQVSVPNETLAEDRQFAGTDMERLGSLQRMLDDASVKAVLMARGGYGSSRIVDNIKWGGFMKSPKWLLGFSDITILHHELHRRGFASMHGCMPVQFSDPKLSRSVEAVRQALFGTFDRPAALTHPLNRQGEGEGIVVGGNVSILVHALATPSDVDFSGKLLFIEDVGEYLYAFDRLMLHLKRAGKLESLAGLMVGQLTDIKDYEGYAVGFGKTAQEIVAEHVQEYDFPVGFGFSIGHEERNDMLVMGAGARLTVGSEGSMLAYTGIR